MIFYIKLGEDFWRKARLLGGVKKTAAPASIAYSSDVSRDYVCIELTISALNGLDIIACDIHTAYLTESFREKIWTIVGPEFKQ